MKENFIMGLVNTREYTVDRLTFMMIISMICFMISLITAVKTFQIAQRTQTILDDKQLQGDSLGDTLTRIQESHKTAKEMLTLIDTRRHAEQERELKMTNEYEKIIEQRYSEVNTRCPFDMGR